MTKLKINAEHGIEIYFPDEPKAKERVILMTSKSFGGSTSIAYNEGFWDGVKAHRENPDSYGEEPPAISSSDSEKDT